MVAWVPFHIFSTTFSFSFKMRNVILDWDREGGFRDRLPK
jgi:hypothetical protein